MVIESMGAKYNQPWEGCESRKHERRGKFVWGRRAVFTGRFLDKKGVLSVEA
jgi:hypothetical protein